MNERDSPWGFGWSRRAYGRLASLLWTIWCVSLALDFDGSAGSSSNWRRRAFSSARWWSGFTLEVEIHLGQFESVLALLATRDVDVAIGMVWLSIDRVVVEWIDAEGDFRFALAVWGKRGDLVSCALVALVAWVVPFASPATGGLKLGRCGSGFGVRLRHGLDLYLVGLFLCFAFVFCFNLC